MGKDTAMPLIEFNKPTQPKKAQPVGAWPVNTVAPVNFDNPIPTNAWNSAPGPANLLPKPQASPLGGFSNPKAAKPISTGMAQAATLPAQKARPIGTPMLASHGPGTNTPLLASPGADLNQGATPLPGQPAAPVQPKAAPIGVMSVQGGGSASIDAQGNINRDAAFNAANRADAIKNHGGIGGTLNVMTPEQDAAVSRQAQPIGGSTAGDKWSFLEDGSASGAAKAGIARKLGFVPEDYDRNASRYAAMITSQGAQYAQAENAIPVAQIGAAANNIIAPASAARHQAEADTLRAELPLVPDMQKSIIGKNVDEGMAKLASASKTKAFDRAKALEENLRITKGDPQAATTLTQQQEYLSNGVGHVIPPQKTVINSESGEPMPYVVSGVIHKENYPQYKSLMDQWANEVKTYNSKRPGALLGIGSGGRDDAYNAHAQRRERILNGLRSLGVTVNPDEQPLQG